MIQLILKLINWWLDKKEASPQKIVPKADPNAVLVLEAQDWVGVIDNDDHTVAQVNAFREAVNKHPTGENWCADFVVFCVQQVEQKLGVKSEMARSELAQDLWFKSPSSLRISSPMPGSVIVWRHGDTILGHTGIVEAVAKDGTLTCIEGNTNEAVGIVRDGGGVYRRLRSPTGTPAMSVIGFLKVF